MTTPPFDRYYGTNDPVAEKLLRQTNELPKLNPPEDKGITSLYVGGLSNEVSERDLRYMNIHVYLSITMTDNRDHFYQYGEIQAINMVHRQGCAFITYTTRQAAEKAAEKSFGSLIIKGKRVRGIRGDLIMYWYWLLLWNYCSHGRMSIESVVGAQSRNCTNARV